MSSSCSGQELIKHVSAVPTSIAVPLLLLRLWTRGRRRSDLHPEEDEEWKNIPMSEPCSWWQGQTADHQVTVGRGQSWTFVHPRQEVTSEGFVTAGADRESRLNWFNLWPLRGRRRWIWSVLKKHSEGTRSCFFKLHAILIQHERASVFYYSIYFRLKYFCLF